MSKSSQPKPPSTLRRSGRALWREVAQAYELEPHEWRLLAQACAVLDTIDQLEAVIANDGTTTVGSTGQTVTHPAVGECRQQRLALTRLLGAIHLPDADGARTTLTGAQSRSAAGHKQRWANVRQLRQDGDRGA